MRVRFRVSFQVVISRLHRESRHAQGYAYSQSCHCSCIAFAVAGAHNNIVTRNVATAVALVAMLS